MACEHYQKNAQSWTRLNQLEHEAHEKGNVAWTVFMGDGSVVLQVNGKDRIVLEA